MAVAKQFSQLTKITNGTTAASDVNLTDIIPIQHQAVSDGVNTLNQISIAQSLCEPVAVVTGTHDVYGVYAATCSNYPGFSLTYKDKNNIDHYLVGMKVRVVFQQGITFGSTSASPATYPSLNINGSGSLPLLAQGKTMASGAASAGQTLEFTLIPYGQGYAWDADSNVRESNSDYTVYTDGLTTYRGQYWITTYANCPAGAQVSVTIPFDKYIVNILDDESHLNYSALFLGNETQVALGSVATNYAPLSNDGIMLEAHRIILFRDNAAGSYRITYAPIYSIII